MPMVKQIVIFFFSGTGNAKRIALWILALSKEKNIPCHVYNIAKHTPYTFGQIDDDALLIFISPIHGFNYPKITLDFIRHFPKGHNQVMLMNTRAGMKIKQWVTPGLTGIAFFLSAFWLRSKGYNIVGQIPYDMPSNWISLHPALNEETVKFIHKNINARVTKHFDKLILGEKQFISHKEIIQDMLIAPVSLLYYCIGRFVFAKTFYATNQCDHCGICIKECPVAAITSKHNHPFWTVKCESCMKCMNDCPTKAIQTSHGLIAVTIVFYFFIIGILYRYVLSAEELPWFLKFVLSNLLFFVLLLILYSAQHVLLKNNIIAKIISHTSFTYYKWWGRYKSIADKIWKKEEYPLK
jgi:ferredoxin/flavodoxin